MISTTIRSLYSEHAQWDFDEVAFQLTPNPTGVGLLRAYIAMTMASRLTGPLERSDVDRALARFLRSAEKADVPAFVDILDTHKQIAILSWMRRQKLILQGKLALQQDEDSYNGTVYRAEHASKGPLSAADRRRFQELTKHMADLNEQLEQRELDELKEIDPQAYALRHEEREAKALEQQVEAKESSASELEVAGWLSELELELNRFMSDGRKMAAIDPEVQLAGC